MDQCKAVLFSLRDRHSPSLERFVSVLCFFVSQSLRQGVSSPFLQGVIALLQSSTSRILISPFQSLILASGSAIPFLSNSSQFLSPQRRNRIWYDVYQSLYAQKWDDAQHLLLSLLQDSEAHSFESFVIVFDAMIVTGLQKNHTAFTSLQQLCLREIDHLALPSIHTFSLLHPSTPPISALASPSSLRAFILHQLIVISLHFHHPVDLFHPAFTAVDPALLTSLTALRVLSSPARLAPLLPLCAQSSHPLLRCLAA